jgi:hypothetical protein
VHAHPSQALATIMRLKSQIYSGTPRRLFVFYVSVFFVGFV